VAPARRRGSDERLLHGLIAAAAAPTTPAPANWSGAVGCAGNAVGRVPWRRRTDAAGVDIEPVRDWCRRLATDPDDRARTAPPTLRIEGPALRFGDLDLPAALLAAPALAGAVTHGDEATFETAAGLAREERARRVGRSLRSYCSRSSASPTPAHRWPRGSRITWNWHSGSGEMSTTCFKRALPGQAPSVGVSGSDGKLGSAGGSSNRVSPPSAVGLSFSSPVSSFGFPSNV